MWCPKIQQTKDKLKVAVAVFEQTKMLVTCQRFGDFFYLGWYSSVQTKYNKGRFKVGLLTCSSNITLRLPSYTGSALKR
jgi:hypothetical protein